MLGALGAVVATQLVTAGGEGGGRFGALAAAPI
jgi:hypothetical protein